MPWHLPIQLPSLFWAKTRSAPFTEHVERAWHCVPRIVLRQRMSHDSAFHTISQTLPLLRPEEELPPVPTKIVRVRIWPSGPMVLQRLKYGRCATWEQILCSLGIEQEPTTRLSQPNQPRENTSSGGKTLPGLTLSDQMLRTIAIGTG